MAKPKKLVMIHQADISYHLDIYITNAPSYTKDVLSVEGTSQISLTRDNLLHTQVDPRYDIQEVSDEIEALLLSLLEVPDIFKQ